MLPDYLIELTSESEGCRLTAYRDLTGILTIGYGHTGNVAANQTITLMQAQELLRTDLQGFWNQISRHTCRSLEIYQQAALTDFAFNLGFETLLKSTLWRMVQKNDPAASEQFSRWIYAGNTTEPGLIIRRAREAKMYKGVTYEN